MAVLSLAGTVAANFNARKLAKDKAEFERLAAKDKQEFDLKVMEIQQDAALHGEGLIEMREELAKCRERHETSERGRDDLRAKIDRLESQLAALTAAK